MKENDISIVSAFPRIVREIENMFIPLAEGIRLAARIWLPEDAEDDPVPAILEFLPYRKRDGTSERDALTHPYYAGHGYACVRVDMRGSGDSEGILEDEYLKVEQDNALEVLEWISTQPWCSGKTGMIGISWGGFNGLQIAARRPPSLKAIVTIASTDDRYADDIHYMALICFLNGSLAREAVRDRYVLDWEGFAQGLRSTPPGNKGGMILPYFDPEIVPHVPKAGVIRENLDDGDAMANVRAVVEAQAMSSKIHARWMEVAITSINVTGGASANEEILQIYASVHGCPVHRFETTNGAALGAALRASQGHRPDISWQEVVEPFTQPIAGSTVRPDPATADTYASLIQAYEALEKRHTG